MASSMALPAQRSDRARIPRPPLRVAARRAPVGQGAAGVQVGDHDDPVRVQDLRRLRHEMHPGEADHVGLGGLCGLRQLQGITEEVRDVLDVAVLVVVRQDDGVPLSLQSGDLRLEVEGRVDGPGGGGSHGSESLGSPCQKVMVPWAFLVALTCT